MEENLMRLLLIEQIHGFAAILSSRGIPFRVPSDDEISGMALHDLQTIVQKVRDLARSPAV